MEWKLRRLMPQDHSHLRDIWIENWGGEFIVVHGQRYPFDHVAGFLIEDKTKWLGVITYIISGEECEISSLNSFKERNGVGTQLINAVLNEARQNNCKRVRLITTNDNLYALGYYQRRGFHLVRIYNGAVNETRKLKPNIPMIGENNIPLRDEIELELKL